MTHTQPQHQAPRTRRTRNARGNFRRRFRGGFTIIELLVAVSVLSGMLFLINTLFFQTTQAVSEGIRTSNVLANTRATNDRISRDASAMLGPNAQNPVPEGGGYIIIVNRLINAPVKRRDGTVVIETFRVDQLIYMASAQTANSRAKRFRSIAPRDSSQYGSDYNSQFALIRYSHGRRTNRDGSDNATFTELGQPFVFGDPVNSGRAAGLDRLANDWILARQAVLFNPSDRFNDSINLPANLANDWHTTAPFVAAFVQNDGLGNRMSAGYCDVTSIPPSGALASALPGFVDTFLDPANALLTPAQIETNYLSLAHVDQRLRINPLPDAAGTNFEAPLVGQVHGVFAPNCSDFIVQFSADANNDGEVDRVGPTGLNDGTVTNGDPIYWYDMDSIDRLDGTFDGNIPDLWGTAAWTGSVVPSPFVDLTPSGLNLAYGDIAYIFRYEDDQAYVESTPGNGDADNSKWPYMIRIRYRLHDAPGKLESNASFRLFDGIDNNLNATADDSNEATVSGRYFEQIIRVPRP